MKIEEYELGYTPNNLKKILFDNGKDREWCADFFGINIKQVHRWCVDSSRDSHQSMNYKRWESLLKSLNSE